jgi:squalene monooxygenase
MLLAFLSFLALFLLARFIYSRIPKSSDKKKNPTVLPTPENNAYDADIIIVGAGVIGSTLSSAFGKMKKRVICIERDMTEPDRIVGELLQPGGVGKLKKLGLEQCVEGIDSPHVQGYGVFYENEKVQLEYPNITGEAEKPTGRSFHYGRFIMNLRKAAKQEETYVCFLYCLIL